MCVHSDVLPSEILVFLKRPPLTPPANTVSSVSSFGSNINPFVLPPTLLGPLLTHFMSSDSPGTLKLLTDEFLDLFKSY